MSSALRTTLLQAVVLGVVCALVVWYLEDFNRKRLVDDWTRFVEGWGAGGPQGQGHGG